MEHEVYVPFPVGTVRQALAEPERVARCVPGVQLDADAAPHCPEGRLRLRIGSSTITYRGSLTVSDAADAAVTVEAKGTESRGDGSVALTLTVRLSPATEPGPGTTLACAGTVLSDGRLAEAPHQSAETAGRRLLDRFAENLADDLREQPPADDSVLPGEPDRHGESEDSAKTVAPGESTAHDTSVPPPSLDPLSDEDAYGSAAYGDDTDGDAPAEAAHARRTMIGRSAEEVDHAPPRGRYAPVPAPQTASTSATLRWAAPAAAVVLASAVVVGRVLRRRR
ncbi:Syd protein [Streptomyces sp. NBRC 110611]|uniref:SRPBCC domain-containing protein n=1 Tax=Streptomyces sp. NBRC 110611 TaxID=1621259 RepID=UPI00082FE27A|nr:SRPBCC domain-containing protein [Streptomyces sp. NBRC 110611]GAU66432.1 Syd protein [Streptomyces sp. NBRC 110611]